MRESIVGAVMAVGFLACAIVAVVAWWAPAHASIVACVAAIAALAIASRAGFEIGRGAGVPTQLVFVPMLFLLPTALVPFLVMAAYVLERLAHHDWRQRLLRLHITIGSCWFALGPVVVLGVAGIGPPTWSRWPLYVLALAAQIGIDLASSALSEWIVFGQSPLTTAEHVARAGLIDAALSPAGLALAIAGTDTVLYALIAGLPLILLLEAHGRGPRDPHRPGERARARPTRARRSCSATSSRRTTSTRAATRAAWSGWSSGLPSTCS